MSSFLRIVSFSFVYLWTFHFCVVRSSLLSPFTTPYSSVNVWLLFTGHAFYDEELFPLVSFLVSSLSLPSFYVLPTFSEYVPLMVNETLTGRAFIRTVVIVFRSTYDQLLKWILHIKRHHVYMFEIRFNRKQFRHQIYTPNNSMGHCAWLEP